MNLDTYLDLKINGETMFDVLLTEWKSTRTPRSTFKNFCIKKFEEWKDEQ